MELTKGKIFNKVNTIADSVEFSGTTYFKII